MLNIIFNKFNSYRDLDLAIERKPKIPIPKKNINIMSIPGRSGNLIEDLGTYEDIEISITFGFQEIEDMENKCRLIKHWLNNIEDNKLIFNYDPNMFYRVKYIRSESIENIKTLGKFIVSFICEPFKYFQYELIEITNNNSLVFNPGTFESKPFIKIYGFGDVNLKVNNNTIKFTNIENYIELDSELMECYKENQILNNKMYGEFPIFQVGENKINWEGNISKIEIVTRWRCL